MKVKQVICHAGEIVKEFIEDQPPNQLSDTTDLKKCLGLGVWDGEKVCMYHCNIYTYHNDKLVNKREERIDGPIFCLDDCCGNGYCAPGENSENCSRDCRSKN